MPRKQRSRYRSRSSGPSKLAWIGGSTEPTNLGPGAKSNTNLTDELPDRAQNIIFKRGLTVQRLHLILRAFCTAATGLTEMAMGVIMVDGDAAAALAFPDPLTDVQSSWLMWDRRALDPQGIQQHIVYDSKSKRRFGSNDANLFFLIDNDDAAETLQFTIGYRLLLKFP